MLSVALALTAAVSWGISDFVGGVTSKRLALAWVLLSTQVVGLSLALPFALARGPLTFDGATILIAMGGSVSGLIGIAALYRAIALGVASIAAPISGTGAVLPVAFGLARGDPTTLVQEIGMAGALIGVLFASKTGEEQALLARPKGPPARLKPLAALLGADPLEGDSAKAESRGRDARIGVGFAVVAAVGFGGFFILLHEASTRDVLWAVSIQRATGVGVLALILLARRPRFTMRWRDVPRLALVGTLDQTANVLYGFASTVGLVSLSAVLVSLYPMVTVILARFVLDERMSRIQKAGIGLALLGVALVAGG